MPKQNKNEAYTMPLVLNTICIYSGCSIHSFPFVNIQASQSVDLGSILQVRRKKL